MITTNRLLGSAEAGSTHAWAELFLPGAGWVTFDPANRKLGGANSIPVAVARDIRLALPITGNFIGPFRRVPGNVRRRPSLGLSGDGT